MFLSNASYVNLKEIIIPFLIQFIMNFSHKSMLILPFFAVLLSYCTKKTDIVSSTESVKTPAEVAFFQGITLDELRITKVVSDSIYTTLEHGLNGKWKLDPSDKLSKDNSGTVITTVENKILKRVLAPTDEVNASWFGLKGDGSDETAVLQAAISASAGRTLVLPSGTFFAKQLNLVSNLVIIGNNTKLRNIQGVGIDNIFLNIKSLQNVQIANLEVALNGIRGDIWAGTTAIQIQGSSNVNIQRCFIHDNTYVGIRLTGDNNHIRLNNNFIENTDTGIHANNTNTDVSIISNIISKGTSEGITIYGYSQQNIPYNFLIDSNIIQYKQNSFGINIAYAKMGLMAHNTISHCLGGITLHDVVSVGKEGLYTSDMEINSNYINNCGFGIIYIGDRTIVSNNRLENIQQDGINVNNFDDENLITKNVTISGNTIISPALAGGGRGGISVKNLVNSSINHNTISKCGNAFSVRFNGNCDNLSITQNNLGDGIVQSNNTIYTSNVSITNNTLSRMYFPASFPSNYVFKMVIAGNTYTTDTTYNTAPNDYGAYNDLNTYNVRVGYSLAAGTVRSLIPSWFGRVIQLKSTNLFTVKNGNNIRLKDGRDIAIHQNKSVSLKYDGSTWNEIARTF